MTIYFFFATWVIIFFSLTKRSLNRGDKHNEKKF